MIADLLSRRKLGFDGAREKNAGPSAPLRMTRLGRMGSADDRRRRVWVRCFQGLNHPSDEDLSPGTSVRIETLRLRSGQARGTQRRQSGPKGPDVAGWLFRGLKASAPSGTWLEANCLSFVPAHFLSRRKAVALKSPRNSSENSRPWFIHQAPLAVVGVDGSALPSMEVSA